MGFRQLNQKRICKHCNTIKSHSSKNCENWSTKYGYYLCNNCYNKYESKLKTKILVWHYSGNICKCEKCDSVSDLSIDHINGDGMEERIRLFGKNNSSMKWRKWLLDNNLPKGYRVLCRKCNSIEFDKMKHLVYPRRYIKENRGNPEAIKEYKEYILSL